MTANTEEDTFEALKRSSYTTVLAEITSTFHTRAILHNGPTAPDIIHKHGWTYDEYVAVGRTKFLNKKDEL